MIHPENLSRLLSPLREVPPGMKKAYMVGGSVRDVLLGRLPKDVDILVPGDPEETARALAMSLGGNHFFLDQDRSILRVIVPAIETTDQEPFPLSHYDISPLGPEPLTRNLAHRDFTIDAIAVSVESLMSSPVCPVIIDPFGGLTDLENKQVRALSYSAFEDDPLRLLRAFRLSGVLGFRIEAETLNWIRSQVSLITRTAAERTQEELFMILSLDRANTVLEEMRESGLLKILAAEDQRQEIDWVHRMEVLKKLEVVLQHPMDFFPLYRTFLETYLKETMAQGIPIRALLKWVVLVDGCDPLTLPDRVDRLVKTSHRFRLAVRNADFLKKVVTGLHHLDQLLHRLLPRNDSDLIPQPEKSIWFYRFFKTTGDGGIGVILIQRSLQTLERETENRLLEEMLFWYEHTFLRLGPPLVNGDDLVEFIGLVPGPMFKQILERVAEEQAAGLVRSRDEALGRVRRWIKSEP